MTNQSRRFSAASVQATPVLLYREAAMAKTIRLLDEVAATDAVQ